MRLAQYLQDNGIALTAFAVKIGVSRQALHRYIAGERTPRPEQMVRIKEVTNEAVTADDFLPVSEAAT